jgi:hypothetical protein
MLQAIRSPIRVPDETDFSIYIILSAALWAWGRLSLSTIRATCPAEISINVVINAV